MAHPPIQQDNTVFFICDLQDRFRPAIHSFDDVVSTARKVVKFAKLLKLPVLVTEQNPTVLGKSVNEIGLREIADTELDLGTHAKNLFSMLTPEVLEALEKRPETKHIAILGIESHICVLQTALDLVSRGYQVHVLADGVSSCNPQEVPIALASIRQAGAQVTTSETLMYQIIRDAGSEDFKAFAQIVKDEKSSTKRSLQNLAKI